MKVNFKNSTAEQLAALLSSESLKVAWTPADEEWIWQQLLSTSIVLELDEFGVGTQALRDACLVANPGIHTFGDLIGHPTPPANVLNAVRRLAKTQALEGSATGFTPMARALYYATVATAMLADIKITKLEDDDLFKGLTWASHLKWLDAKTKQIVERAQKKYLDY
jgi:hypothetical protein